MLAIIGGSGLTQLASLDLIRREVVRTPYGEPSGALTFGRLCARKPVVFLARHGYGHTIPPHRVNYQANLWALHQAKVDAIISVASVGGIRADLCPGSLVVPNQIIDYTWGARAPFMRTPRSRWCTSTSPSLTIEALRQRICGRRRRLVRRSPMVPCMRRPRARGWKRRRKSTVWSGMAAMWWA
jgi:purine nucleoside phosphorylase